MDMNEKFWLIWKYMKQSYVSFIFIWVCMKPFWLNDVYEISDILWIWKLLIHVIWIRCSMKNYEKCMSTVNLFGVWKFFIIKSFYELDEVWFTKNVWFMWICLGYENFLHLNNFMN